MSLDYGPYDRDTLDRSYHWLQNAELRDLTSTPAITRQSQLAWFDTLPKKKDYQIWSLKADGAPIGAFGLKKVTEENAEYWGYIGDPANWGKGFGSRMMDFAETEATLRGLAIVYLTVVFANYRAINLYFKKGYKITDVHSTGYRMEKNLNAARL